MSQYGRKGLPRCSLSAECGFLRATFNSGLCAEPGQGGWRNDKEMGLLCGDVEAVHHSRLWTSSVGLPQFSHGAVEAHQCSE